MQMQIALAGSPLTELHLPKSNDPKFLFQEINQLPEISKGHVKATVFYDHLGNGDAESNAHVILLNSVGNAEIKFHNTDGNWEYEATLTIGSSKPTLFKGTTGHKSIKSIVRKVKALAIMLS